MKPTRIIEICANSAQSCVEAEAKRLLLYSNKSSKEIAGLLGFEDQSSFSRFFKNMTGQSTVQFRNSSEGKN